MRVVTDDSSHGDRDGPSSHIWRERRNMGDMWHRAAVSLPQNLESWYVHKENTHAPKKRKTPLSLLIGCLSFLFLCTITGILSNLSVKEGFVFEEILPLTMSLSVPSVLE